MTESTAKGGIRNTLSRAGGALTRIRNFTLNALFLLFLLILIVALFADGTPVVPDDSALLVNPRGVLVDQRSQMDPLAEFFAPDTPGEVELGQITAALERAAADDRIRLAVLDLDELIGMSAGQAMVIGRSIREFQDEGKEVIAYGSGFGQSQYLLASFADALYMHPMGQLILPGYGGNRLYFKELLDKLNVNIHIFQAGKYKEFVEPYSRSDMSEEARQANQELVDELWAAYRAQLLENRKLEAPVLDRFTHSLPEQLEAMGDLATVALEHHLVDELLNLDEVRARIASEVGYANDGEFLRIGFEDYLAANPAKRESGKSVAVITAEGPIMMGRQSQGVIAADTISALIRRAREDDDVAALVLRVNSPGGSAFASEIIRQELEILQLTGKPVVASMGNVAASGGYWISSTADRIYARPTTITGSIGVFGIIPTFERALNEVGVHTDGIGTTPLSRAFDPFAGLSEEMKRILQLNTEETYEQFVSLVARGRDMAPEAVDGVSQGRVWTGTAAQAIGLVDELGSLEDAIAKAAELAELAEYRTKRIRPDLSPREILMSSLIGSESEWLPLGGSRIASALAEAERFLEMLNDPGNSYAVCELCMGPSELIR
jgi:protease-4